MCMRIANATKSAKPTIHSGGQSAPMIRPPSNGGIGIMLKRFKNAERSAQAYQKRSCVASPIA